jgi:hypothetical protein
VRLGKITGKLADRQSTRNPGPFPTNKPLGAESSGRMTVTLGIS